ncbi:hypothetical protein V5740_04485 [Croceibacterium sp. TMG7-5b_MA50]|uniref:hypothetical protein n=1 Tax=Croceibacterium sp. TMG7-5b_MA50 TaxID=3121290 RepID=UPI003222031B
MYEFVDRPLARQERGIQLFVWSMRQWAAAAKDGRCVCRLIGSAFRSAEVQPGTDALFYGMRVLCQHGRTPMRFGAVQRASITEDEAILTSALLAASDGRSHVVQSTCDALVTEAAAPVLAACLQALAKAFGDARLALVAQEG